MRRAIFPFLLALLCAEMKVGAYPAPDVIAATFLGGAGPDDFADVAVLPDGTFLAAGNFSSVPPSVSEVRSGPGEPVEGSGYRRAMLLRFDPQGRKVIGAFALPLGEGHFDSVIVGDGAIYVGGFARADGGLRGWTKEAGGFDAGLAAQPRGVAMFTPAEHYSHPQVEKGLDERGLPVVLKLGPDLALQGVAFLEGWQSRWHVPRPLEEDWTQPVRLAVVAGGDVVVAHDGGYNRLPDADRGSVPGYEDFYLAVDHLSRLSADLKTRRWHREVAMTPVDPDAAGRYLRAQVKGHPMTVWNPAEAEGPWLRDALGNPHTLSLDVAPDGRLLVAGFASSRTSMEPWWSPYCLLIDAGKGETVGSIYTPSPMAADGRMNGLVSDSLIFRAVPGPGKTILVSGGSDGGNSVLKSLPTDFSAPLPGLKRKPWGFRGRTLFAGILATVSLPGLEPVHATGVQGHDRKKLFGAWVTDLEALPGGGIAAVGRHTGAYPVTAWPADPGGFVEVYAGDLNPLFSGGLPGAIPAAVSVRDGAVAVVGSIRPGGVLPLKHPIQGAGGGDLDAFLLILNPEQNP